MAEQSYPATLTEVDSWSRANGVTTLEGRIRFMGFVILNCIAAHQSTKTAMALKGGNALRFAYQSPRSTKDLDFTAVTEALPDNDCVIRQLLDNALAFAEKRFNVKAKCQAVKRQPNKKQGSTRPTYLVTVAYQFPTDRYFHTFEGRVISTIVPLEITLNDLVCDTEQWSGIHDLKVCSLEDILAEKLRALLQQKSRGRNRWQDVYDICYMCRQRPEVDREKIADFLKRKSAIRDIEVRKSNFDNEIRDIAATEYDVRVQKEAPHDFIPFDDAWQDVLSLVQSLDISD